MKELKEVGKMLLAQLLYVLLMPVVFIYDRIKKRRLVLKDYGAFTEGKRKSI